MRRREFITLLGGVAAARPLAARAQQTERIKRIGVLMNPAADDESQADVAVFVQGLQRLGWVDGGNVRIDIRWGNGNPDIIGKHAAELVALTPDVIFTTGGAPVASLFQATRTVPIVFALAPDPVGSGYVTTLSRPGGNATGFMMFEYTLSAKWPQLLKEIAPGTTRVAVLRDPANAPGIGQFAVIQSVAPSVGVEVNPIDTSNTTEIERRIDAFAAEPNGGLIILPPPLVAVDREGDPQFVALEQPEFWLVPGPANALQFNKILAAAGFRCNVQESGVSCRSETSGKGFTFSARGYTPQYTDVPANAP